MEIELPRFSSINLTGTNFYCFDHKVVRHNRDGGRLVTQKVTTLSPQIVGLLNVNCIQFDAEITQKMNVIHKNMKRIIENTLNDRTDCERKDSFIRSIIEVVESQKSQEEPDLLLNNPIDDRIFAITIGIHHIVQKDSGYTLPTDFKDKIFDFFSAEFTVLHVYLQERPPSQAFIVVPCGGGSANEVFRPAIGMCQYVVSKR